MRVRAGRRAGGIAALAAPGLLHSYIAGVLLASDYDGMSRRVRQNPPRIALFGLLLPGARRGLWTFVLLVAAFTAVGAAMVHFGRPSGAIRGPWQTVAVLGLFGSASFAILYVTLPMLLALSGKTACLIDADIGLRNLDIVLGLENRIVYDLVDVVEGNCRLKQAFIRDKHHPNLCLIPAAQTRDKEAVSPEQMADLCHKLKQQFDFVIVDSPAGIEKGAHLAMYFADRAVVVVNPEVSSVRDSDLILGLLASKTLRAEKGDGKVQENLLLTRYSPRRVASGEMMSVDDVKEILGLDVIGVIPESPDVLSASNAGNPVILNGESEASMAYEDSVARLLGETLPLRFLEEPKKGFFARMFGG